jgi:protein gp37
MLDVPLRNKKPTLYFVNSMSDLFHEDLPDQDIARVFAVMGMCDRHTFQILTKRDLSNRVPRTLSGAADWIEPHIEKLAGEYCALANWPLSNVWLGVSVEDRKRTYRIDQLRAAPAALRFLSLEPLLEDLGELDLRGIDWVIAGGESGPGARAVRPSWVRSIRERCQAEGVRFFFKQWGEYLPDAQNPAMTEAGRAAAGASQGIRVGKKRAGSLLDGREYREMPPLWDRPLLEVAR